MAIQLNPKFDPLFTTDKRYIIVTGGRGSSKSFSIATFLCLLTYEIGHRILFSRYTMTSAELSIIPEFLDKVERLEVPDDFKATKSEVVNVGTGSEIIFKGIKTSSGIQTAALKSLAEVSTWVLDEAEELVDKATFDKIDLSIRTQGVQNRVILILNPTDRDHWIWKHFFENSHKIIKIDGCDVPISTHPEVCHIHTTYLDNLANLSASFLQQIQAIKTEDPQRYAHEIIGGWKLQPEGTLFSRSELRRYDPDTFHPENAEAILGYIDVADQGDDDYCFVIGYCFRGEVFITDVMMTTDGIDVTLPLTVDKINSHTVRDDKGVITRQMNYIRVETNNQGGEVIRGLRAKIDPGKILGVTNSTSKHTRILMSRHFVLNYCRFKQDKDIPHGSEYSRFITGVCSYMKDGSSKHDDAPDALSGLTQMVGSFLPHLFQGSGV